MEFKLKIYPSYSNDFGFPPEEMSVWITQADSQKFLDVESSFGPVFVKIENKGPLGKFCFYAKLDVINPIAGVDNGFIWVPKELIHKSVLANPNMQLHVSLVNDRQFERAEVVTIQLPEKLVESWSEDEEKAAYLSLKSHNLIAFKNQMVFVRPKTKKSVIGEVISIYPKKHIEGQVYSITEETKIVFEGLSKNKQKVVDFSQIGGLDATINKLREIIQIPLNHSGYLKRFGITPPRGLLLYGPPGNGKTMLAKAIAYSMGSHFITIEGPELTTSLVGQGEEKLREKFEEARQKGNCVIFIDEIDSLAPIRDGRSARHEITTVATLLNLMDGMGNSNGILVIGATNRIETIDPALRRPGRFDLEFEIPMPSQESRCDILKKILFSSKDVNCDESVNISLLKILAELTTGYSGADMKFLYREACMNAIRDHVSFCPDNGKIIIDALPNEIFLNEKHFFEALKVITPTSLRGAESMTTSVKWEDIIGLDEQKKQLSHIYESFVKLCLSDELICRPSYGNILLTGKKGTGKRTLINSFAQKENLEIINLDFLNLDSVDVSESLEIIEKTVKKCKQLNNVILVLMNIENTHRKDCYINKAINEINSLNRHSRVFVILVCENKNSSEEFVGYKKFGFSINLDIDNVYLAALVARHKLLQGAEVSDYSTIGEILTIHNQNRILSLCE